MELDDFDLGYVLGLLIGEGYFGGGNRESSASIVVTLHADDPQPLFALAGLLGGRLYGPYHSNGRRSLTWKATGPDARRIARLIGPCFPPSRKRDQFVTWALRYGIDTTDVPNKLIPSPKWTAPGTDRTRVRCVPQWGICTCESAGYDATGKSVPRETG